jgi:RNA polymerase sigma-70 factor (ECF subfamily)
MSLCACNEICNPFRPSGLKFSFSLPALIDRVSEPEPLETDRDVELLQRVARQDRDAFAEFYDRHSTLLFSVACKILNDQTDAEDVVQETFVHIWEKAPNFDPNLGKASSWAATMARNKAIDRIRAAQRRTRLAEEAGSEMAIANESDATVNDAVHGHDKAKLIQTAIVTLPAEQRQAIELAFFSELTQIEISEKLKQPLGTIKARIRRGLLKLRDQLEGLL